MLQMAVNHTWTTWSMQVWMILDGYCVDPDQCSTEIEETILRNLSIFWSLLSKEADNQESQEPLHNS